MKIFMSMITLMLSIALPATLGSTLFAVCHIRESLWIGTLGFMFIIFAPTAALLIAALLQTKIGPAWMAAPSAFLACAITYGCTGFVAEWTLMVLAEKETTREFWAFYWILGFAFSAIFLSQLRFLWGWTFAALQKSRSSRHSQLRGADAPRRG
jgi:hypothetical protein